MARPGHRDAVVGDREVKPADQAVILIHRRAVWNQAEQARATSTMLVDRCLRAAAQSLVVCRRAANAYADARSARQAAARCRWTATTGQDPAATLGWFQVEGLVDGQPVGAVWTPGGLVCNPALRARAELLVDLEEVFCDAEGLPRYMASLEGPDVVVALTLLRACDPGAGFIMFLPSAADGPHQADATMP